VQHLSYIILKGVASYVKRTRRAKCRQANERWTGSDANNLKWLINGITTRRGRYRTWWERCLGNQLIRSLACHPVRLSTRQPLFFVRFSARNLTQWVPFLSTNH